MQLYPNLTQTLDADGLRNFNKHVFFPKFLQDPSLIDIMLPKTLDEIKAEDENQQLADDKYTPIAPTDNHTTHIYTHMMVQPKTWALWFHLAEHEKALAGSMQGQQGQAPGQQGQQKVSESISFKDLPPEGKVAMAAQAGIKLDSNSVALNQQNSSSPNQPQNNQVKVNAEKKNPLKAATPLVGELNNKTVSK